jgi:hypothetical protein
MFSNLLWLMAITAIGLAANASAQNDTEIIRTKVGSLYTQLNAVASGELQPDPADTTLEGVAWFADFLSSVRENWGEVKQIDSPTYNSDHEASIVVRLELCAYEISLQLDQDGEWGQMKLSNYVAEEDRSKLEWSDLGDDTLRVADLPDLSTLVQTFNADSGKVRLVSILSPT